MSLHHIITSDVIVIVNVIVIVDVIVTIVRTIFLCTYAVEISAALS